MKKLYAYRVAFILALMVILMAACGEKSQEDVIAKLEKNTEEMTGYKAKAEMSMNTGQEEQKFNIEIWYKQGDFYRVTLENNLEEQESQIILKNEDGVFVLTPALDKSFKFQTEWPENSSQPYLYQSLVKDVLKDTEAAFNSSENDYVFKTKTNYQSNNNLPFQEIHFDKSTYTPSLVKVLDKDQNGLVEVNFKSFEMDPAFEDDDFTMEKNMQGSKTDDETASAQVQSTESEDLTVLYPVFTAGAEIQEKKEMEMENGTRVMMTFEGEKNFTLIEERNHTAPAMSTPQEVIGDIVNLGYTVAAMSENTMEWTYNGVDFTLASNELTREEMIQVAQSVQGQEAK
ncbi:LolA family protein [Oceanobacillus massiliensis]|uniref:LolA family protein n=1 Tax=Oceanobacillus massiliensis TaxID=1465765 RepID=UPI0002888221|nr:outer membrane lipoprotein carrier protein LolA [Oceanobacillus massiliensis]